MERRLPRGGWGHRAFLLGVALKGVDGLVELLGGALMLAVPSESLHRVFLSWSRHELDVRHDFLAEHLAHAAASLSLGAKRFVAIYLLTHGLLKAGLVWGLLRAKLWAYPTAIVVFAAFVAYQLYRYRHTASAAMLALTALDLAIILLTIDEYRRARQAHCART